MWSSYHRRSGSTAPQSSLLDVDISAGEPLHIDLISTETHDLNTSGGISPLESITTDDVVEPGQASQSARTSSATQSISTSRISPRGTIELGTNTDTNRPELFGDSATINSGASLDSDSLIKNAWAPYTLRRRYLWALVALSLGLGSSLVVLRSYSKKHYGLSTEKSAPLGWRFIPTLIAVLWGQLIVMLFDDIRRTEPFARLASAGSKGLPAAITICQDSRVVWVSLIHGLSIKSNGKRGWVLVFGSIINIFAFIAISPLSSLLLDTQPMQYTKNSTFLRLVPQQSLLKLDRDTYLRTTSALFQGLETSPWISDHNAVLPFSPYPISGLSWNANSSLTPQQWQTETTVFRSNFQLHKFHLVSKATSNSRLNSTGDTKASIHLRSSNGCEYSLSGTTSSTSMIQGFATWSNIESFAFNHSLQQNNISWHQRWEDLQFAYSDECRGGEIIIVSTPWISGQEFISTFTLSAYLGFSTLTMATVPVAVSISETGTKVHIDEQHFRESEKPVPETLFNLSQIREIQTTPEWFSYIPSQGESRAGATPEFGGLSALLGAQYNFSMQKLTQDNNLAEQAMRIRGRFLSEVLRTTASQMGGSVQEASEGKIVIQERRMVVNSEIAIALAVLFWFSFILLLLLIRFSRSSERPLNINHEPGSVLGTATLVSSETTGLSSLQRLDQSSKETLKKTLLRNYYSTTPGVLHEIQCNTSMYEEITADNKLSTPTRSVPRALRLHILISLLISLLSLIIVIIVLSRFANSSGLSQSAFLYQTSLTVFGHPSYFTPFSIIPTLIAIGIGLWWNAIDSALRILQPYISMTRRPSSCNRGFGISYHSSYWIWASWRAARNGHWLLSLVTFGSLLAQFFIVAMSALLERQPGVLLYSREVERTLEIRQIPHVRLVSAMYPPYLEERYVMNGAQYVSTSLLDLFQNLSTNWMYSAVIHTAMEGSEPSWSHMGWSFVPVNVSSLTNLDQSYLAHTIAQDQRPLESSLNVTVSTPAIRGRVECSPLDALTNQSSWLHFFNNSILEDERGYYPLPSMFLDEDHQTSATSAPRIVSCCLNGTFEDDNPLSAMAIGYWSLNVGEPSLESITGWTGNFTAKWIRGRAEFDTDDDDDRRLIFPDAPSMQALNCQPIIETSVAQVTVDVKLGRVYTFTILDEPQVADVPWLDSFVMRNLSDPSQADDIYIPESPEEMNGPFMGTDQNMTTGFGILFMHALLRAADLDSLHGTELSSSNYTHENFDDKVFNIRTNESGLNLDFMSYASYLHAGRDADALLDYGTLLNQTQHTFSTFFQHYVSSSVSIESGGWAYQPIGAQLIDIGPPAQGFTPNQKGSGRDYPHLNTDRTANVSVSVRAEVIRMNPVATWLSIGILIWLTTTTLILTVVQRRYLGSMIRNVESIADVLVLIAGSSKLLKLVRERGVEKLKSDRDIYTRLGWFTGEDGRRRWGIEVVERDVETPETVVEDDDESQIEEVT